MRLEAVKPSRLSRYLQRGDGASRQAGSRQVNGGPGPGGGGSWLGAQAGRWGGSRPGQCDQRAAGSCPAPPPSGNSEPACALVAGVISVAGRGPNQARGASRVLADADIEQLWVLLRQQGQGVAGAGVSGVCGAGSIEGVGIAPGGAPAEVSRARARARVRGKQRWGWERP
jgi:hypothetical protein